MKLRDAASLCACSLAKRPLRTLLTILGLGVGIGAILAVLTLGSAGEAQVEAEIARLGVNKVWITANADSDGFTQEHSAAIAAATGTSVCAGAYTAATVRANGSVYPAQIVGYDAGAEQVHRPVILQGRMFLPYEYEAGAPLALIDEALLKTMDGCSLGCWLDIGYRRFTVIGVVESAAQRSPSLGAGMVILPLSTFLDTFDAPIAELTLSINSDAAADEVAAALATLGGNESSWTVASLQTEIDAARQVIRIFVSVLACVAAVCMATGAIGVMNILLVSVRERRREIGLMKAVGATRAQVGLLFLLEAAGYGLAGGALGLALGAVMIRLFAAIVSVSAHLKAQDALAVWLVAMLLTTLFGAVPAARAARLQPVDALREEQ